MWASQMRAACDMKDSEFGRFPIQHVSIGMRLGPCDKRIVHLKWTCILEIFNHTNILENICQKNTAARREVVVDGGRRQGRHRGGTTPTRWWSDFQALGRRWVRPSVRWPIRERPGHCASERAARFISTRSGGASMRHRIIETGDSG